MWNHGKFLRESWNGIEWLNVKPYLFLIKKCPWSEQKYEVCLLLDSLIFLTYLHNTETNIVSSVIYPLNSSKVVWSMYKTNILTWQQTNESLPTTSIFCCGSVIYWKDWEGKSKGEGRTKIKKRLGMLRERRWKAEKINKKRFCLKGKEKNWKQSGPCMWWNEWIEKIYT